MKAAKTAMMGGRSGKYDSLLPSLIPYNILMAKFRLGGKKLLLRGEAPNLPAENYMVYCEYHQLKGSQAEVTRKKLKHKPQIPKFHFVKMKARNVKKKKNFF